MENGKKLEQALADFSDYNCLPNVWVRSTHIGGWSDLLRCAQSGEVRAHLDPLADKYKWDKWDLLDKNGEGIFAKADMILTNQEAKKATFDPEMMNAKLKAEEKKQPLDPEVVQEEKEIDLDISDEEMEAAAMSPDNEDLADDPNVR